MIPISFLNIVSELLSLSLSLSLSPHQDVGLLSNGENILHFMFLYGICYFILVNFPYFQCPGFY
jgi:hypothetical protein